MRADFQALIAQITHRDLYTIDPSLTAAVVQNACVRSVGTTEVSIRLAIYRYCSLRSPPEVATYVGRQLENFYNPKVKKVADLLGCLSARWQDDFLSFATDERRDALNSLVENKNRIAHGQYSGIGAATLKPWIVRASETCDFIDGLLS